MSIYQYLAGVPSVRPPAAPLLSLQRFENPLERRLLPEPIKVGIGLKRRDVGEPFVDRALEGSESLAFLAAESIGAGEVVEQPRAVRPDLDGYGEVEDGRRVVLCFKMVGGLLGQLHQELALDTPGHQSVRRGLAAACSSSQIGNGLAQQQHGLRTILGACVALFETHEPGHPSKLAFRLLSLPSDGLLDFLRGPQLVRLALESGDI